MPRNPNDFPSEIQALGYTWELSGSLADRYMYRRVNDGYRVTVRPDESIRDAFVRDQENIPEVDEEGNRVSFSRPRGFTPPPSMRTRSREKENLSPKTFGVELEVNNVVSLIEPLPENWRYTNDISVQSNSPSFRRKPVKYDPSKFNLHSRDERMGTEIVSPILENVEDIYDVLDNVKETGIKTESKDCGIHCHVSFPKGEQVITLFKMALKYEPIFYAMGSYGRFSRGKYKDYIYQRPLTFPPIVKVSSGDREFYHGHIFDYENIDKVNNIKDFKLFMSAARGGKYHGAKYCGINFYSLFKKGTIEFRTFNLTTNYPTIKALVNLSRDFAFAGVREYFESGIDYPYEVNFINDTPKGKILDLFLEFYDLYSNFMDDEDRYNIIRYIENSPTIIIPKKVYFHLIYHRRGDNTPIYNYPETYRPEKISEEVNPKKPKAEQLSNYEFNL